MAKNVLLITELERTLRHQPYFVSTIKQTLVTELEEGDDLRDVFEEVADDVSRMVKEREEAEVVEYTWRKERSELYMKRSKIVRKANE